MQSVVVLGAGMMGTAFCFPLVDAGLSVSLVGTHLDGELVDAMEAGRPHPGLKVEVPSGVTALPVTALEGALERADAVVLGVSSAGIDWACDVLSRSLRRPLPIGMITKGLRRRGEASGETLATFVDVVAERLEGAAHPPSSTMAVAGPCIAGELARRVPTCVVVTSRSQEALEAWRAALSTDYYLPTTSTDVVGVEVCAAMKNAYAMGVAFGAGLHEKRGGAAGSVAMHNFESAVFAQAAVEMQRLVEALGGTVASVCGLAGVGDLDVTNNGGRTGRFGRHLGRGLRLPEAIAAMEGATLECLEILREVRPVVSSLIAAGRLPARGLPLFDHLCAVALDGAPVDVPFARFF